MAVSPEFLEDTSQENQEFLIPEVAVSPQDLNENQIPNETQVISEKESQVLLTKPKYTEFGEKILKPEAKNLMRPNNYFTTKMEHLKRESMNYSFKEISKPKESLLSEQEIVLVIEKLAASYGLTPTKALISIYLLMLAGAAITATPPSLKVEIKQDGTNAYLEIEKGNLLGAYKLINNNPYLRSLAEALADDISNFAQKNNQKGDLANKINKKLLAEGKDI